MEKGDDPYEILGVSYDASEDDIKKAYRKLALKYHPDRAQEGEDKEKAHDIFSKIAAANDTLTDPVKRYDWKLANEHKLKAAASGAKPAPRADTSENADVKRSNSSGPVSSSRPPKPATANNNETRSRSLSPVHGTSGPAKKPPGHAVPPQRTKSPSRPSDAEPPSVPAAYAREDLRAPKPNTSYSSRGLGAKEDPYEVASAYSMPATATSAPVDRIPRSAQSVGPRRSVKASSRAMNNMRAPDLVSEGGSEPFKKPGLKSSTQPLNGSAHGPRRGSIQAPRSAGSVPRRSVKTSNRAMNRIGIPDLESASNRSTAMPRNSSMPKAASYAVREAPVRPPVRQRVSVAGAASPRAGPRKYVAKGPPNTGPGRDDRRKSIVTKPSVDGANLSQGETSAVMHDPYEAIAKIMMEAFPDDYWEREWKTEGKKKGLFGGSKDNSKPRVLQAISKFNPKNPNTVVSVTTSTKKERRTDQSKLYDIKTITKILRLDGSVEKIVQASVADKEQAKSIDAETLTISREKSLIQFQQHARRQIGGRR